MSVSYSIFYRGRPQGDPAAFLNYYYQHHVPLVSKFPKVRSVEVHQGGEAAPFFLITRLEFDSMEDLRAALDSKERTEAKTEFQRSVSFDGEVINQVSEMTRSVPSARGQIPGSG